MNRQYCSWVLTEHCSRYFVASSLIFTNMVIKRATERGRKVLKGVRSRLRHEQMNSPESRVTFCQQTQFVRRTEYNILLFRSYNSQPASIARQTVVLVNGNLPLCVDNYDSKPSGSSANRFVMLAYQEEQAITMDIIRCSGKVLDFGLASSLGVQSVSVRTSDVLFPCRTIATFRSSCNFLSQPATPLLSACDLLAGALVLRIVSTQFKAQRTLRMQFGYLGRQVLSSCSKCG